MGAAVGIAVVHALDILGDIVAEIVIQGCALGVQVLQNLGDVHCVILVDQDQDQDQDQEFINQDQNQELVDQDQERF